MDSYKKYSDDFWSKVSGNASSCLQEVAPSDLEEVKLSFALMVAAYENPDNFRIYPLPKKKEFDAQKAKGCCGSFDTQIKCKSGRIYWAGFNWGH